MTALNSKTRVSERNRPMKTLAKIEVMKLGATEGQKIWGLDLPLGLLENV